MGVSDFSGVSQPGLSRWSLPGARPTFSTTCMQWWGAWSTAWLRGIY